MQENKYIVLLQFYTTVTAGVFKMLVLCYALN